MTAMKDNNLKIEGFEYKRLEIKEIIKFQAEYHQDERGYVMPSFSQGLMESLGVSFDVIHENHCFSLKRGTVRGFHYQLPPYGQAKLMRVTKGRILDVSIDLREGSPTFGHQVKVELEPNGWNQLLVPEGFAHCYCTLEDETEVLFKLNCAFAPLYARGLSWNDPSLGVDWPIPEEEAIVLNRDLDRPKFTELTEFYPYE